MYKYSIGQYLRYNIVSIMSVLKNFGGRGPNYMDPPSLDTCMSALVSEDMLDSGIYGFLVIKVLSLLNKCHFFFYNFL